jgi:hypothetical protein
MTQKKLTKKERLHAAQLERQRRRNRKPRADQVDSNRIGRNLCEALVRSHQEHRQGST